MLEIGSLVDGKYKILNKVGQGGMSVVYLAMNEKANKQWAVKEVRKDGVRDFEVVKQGLVAETDILKKLSHPNLPSIIDVIDTDESFIIIMDYIQGNSLNKALEEFGAQPQENVIIWAKQLCDVLNYLHTRTPAIIYRDMKPANIMLKPDGNVHRLMLSLGFSVKDDWEPIYSYYRGDEYYEIHTQIMEIDVSEKADYRDYFARAWDHAHPVSGHSYRFTPEFHFLYMLTHIAKHIHGSGAGIRLYLDVAAFIRKQGANLDWPWIEAQLRELKLHDFARVVLSASARWFGIPCPLDFPPVPEETLRDFTEFTLEAGVFGHHNRDGALAQMKHEEQLSPVQRAKLLLRLAFPKAETIQARYTYLQDKPWLLPAAWVHRLVKTRAGTEQHLEAARQIIQADTEEVDKLKKLAKDIGL